VITSLLFLPAFGLLLDVEREILAGTGDGESSMIEMERALCRGYQVWRKRASANEFGAISYISYASV
jgi:hypothetical protein